MKQITSITPRRRCQETVRYDDGSEAVRCYSPAAPRHYQKASGEFYPVNLAHVEEFVAKPGPAMKMNHSAFSVGVRKDKIAQKIIGIRPDYDEALGNYQFELSLSRVVINGIDQILDLDVPSFKSADANQAHLEVGSLKVDNRRSGVRLLWPMANTAKSFRIEFAVTRKNTEIAHDAIADEYEVTNDRGFLFRLTQPKLTNESYEVLPDLDHSALIRHELINNGDGTHTYVKESRPAFADAVLPATYFVDADIAYTTAPDGYIYREAGNFGSARSGDGTSLKTGVNYLRTGLYTPLSNYVVERTFLFFDTSGIPASGIVEAAQLTIQPLLFSGNAPFEITPYESLAEAPLALTDFGNSGGAWGDSFVFPDTSYIERTIPLNSAACEGLQRGGTARICLRQSKEADGIAHESVVAISSYENDPIPYLELTIVAAFFSDMDGILKKTGITRGAALDTILMRTGLQVSSQVDGTVQKQGLVSAANFDGILGTDSSLATQLNTVLLSQQARYVFVSAIIRALGVTAPVDVDAILLKIGNAPALMNAILQAGVTRSVILDALVQATRSAAVSMDAKLLPPPMAINATMDAVLRYHWDSPHARDTVIAPLRDYTVKY